MKGWNTYSDTCDGVNTDVMRWILMGLEVIMRAHSLHESPTFVHYVQQVWEKEQSSRWLVASDTRRFTAYNPILCLLYCVFNNHRPSLHVEPEKMIQKAFPLVQIKLNDITPKILDNVSGSIENLLFSLLLCTSLGIFRRISPNLVLCPLWHLTHVLQLWCHGLGAQGDGRRSQPFSLLRCCQEKSAKCRHNV